MAQNPSYPLKQRAQLYLQSVGHGGSIQDLSVAEPVYFAHKLVEVLDELERLGVWAQNDINMRTGHGQHIGSPKFASLSVAKEVRSIVRRLCEEVE